MKGDARRERRKEVHRLLVVDERKQRVAKFLKIKQKDVFKNQRAAKLIFGMSKRKMDSVLNE